jgi:hypothetical protein
LRQLLHRSSLAPVLGTRTTPSRFAHEHLFGYPQPGSCGGKAPIEDFQGDKSLEIVGADMKNTPDSGADIA